jgi:hypothetical protein
MKHLILYSDSHGCLREGDGERRCHDASVVSHLDTAVLNKTVIIYITPGQGRLQGCLYFFFENSERRSRHVRQRRKSKT